MAFAFGFLCFFPFTPSKSELREVLQTKLKLRPPNWPVYFTGDPSLEWQGPVKAIDIIRGLQAEVVLLKSVSH